MAVIVQGVLGGTRVTHVSTVLAAVHGVVGQAFFGLMVVLCVLTGKGWQRQTWRVADLDHLRRRALVLLGMVLAQIALGSWLRHYGARTVLVAHGVVALAVWAHALVFVLKVKGGPASYRGLFPSSLAAAVTATAQIILGVVAMVYLLPFDGVPGRCRFTRPWYGPVIRPMERSCWRRPSCSRCGRFVFWLVRRRIDLTIGTKARHGRRNRPRLIGRRLLEIRGVDRSTALVHFGRPSDLLAAISGRLAAYLSLTKPRLVVLVLVTVAIGFLLGPRGGPSGTTVSSLAATLVGTALVAGGAAHLTNGWSASAMPRCGGRRSEHFPPAACARRKPRSSAAWSPCWERRSCSWGPTCSRPWSRS